MAFISSAFTAGQTLTAASMEDLRGNANAGHSVFTNEAARDAAITAPTEGLMAYLTAPTVPAATGATTAVPSGVVTIYNGSAWVCVTPVSTFTSASGTYTTAAWGTTLGGTPGANPSVTLTTGTTALLQISANLSASTTMTLYLDVAVSGATTIAAGTAAAQGITHSTSLTGLVQTVTSHFVVTGLTAGSNTFTLSYFVSTGTGTFAARRLTAQGIA